MKVSVDTVAEMPDGTGSQGSKYDDVLNPAIERYKSGDTAATVLRFEDTTKDEARAFMRNLSHAANVRGLGLSTVLKDEESGPVGYFIVRDKREVVRNGNGAAEKATAPAKKAAK